MNKYKGFNEKVIFMIHMYARKLFNKRVLHAMDVEDIEQELMLDVLKSLGNYKEHLGSIESFLSAVIRNSANELLIKNFCQKRDGKITFEELSDEFADPAAAADKIIECIDFSKAINNLPFEKRILCMFAGRHSFSEISKIFGINRTTLYSKFKVIQKLLKSMSCSQKFYCSDKTLTTLEEHMRNISVLETLTAKEISRLGAADLMDLSDQITNLTGQVNEMTRKLEDGLNLRYSAAVQNNLRSEGKDTGTTRFFDGSHQIIADIPKKVTWDTEKMEEVIKKISKERREDLIKITYSVDERKYLALPSELRNVFTEARAVTPGKTRFNIRGRES